MKRLVAETKDKSAQQITCYTDLVNMFTEQLITVAVCKAVETTFLQSDNAYIVERFLKTDNNAEANNAILESLEFDDILDIIINADYDRVVENVLQLLRIKKSQVSDIEVFGEEIVREWTFYERQWTRYLFEIATEKKWKTIRKRYPAYFQTMLCVEDIYGLDDLEDFVGDNVKLWNRIDYDTRDNPFLYLDGEIVWGGYGKTHTQTLLTHNQNNNNDSPLSSSWHRLDADEIQKANNVKAVGFGHYGNNVAVVERNSEGCNEDDIKKSLLHQSTKDIHKVYLQENRYLLKRIAKNYY